MLLPQEQCAEWGRHDIEGEAAAKNQSEVRNTFTLGAKR